MYVFGNLGSDVRIILKWVLQEPSQEIVGLAMRFRECGL
jgi:hypothetical protein